MIFAINFYSNFEIFIQGFFLSVGLIVAIGLQNAFILRQGIKNRFVFASCLTAASCDAILILVGVLGFGALLNSMPWLLVVLHWVGAVFLLLYAAKSFKSALSAETLDHSKAKGMGREANLKETILVVLGVTLLNPHVYLDTVILLGGISISYAGFGPYVFGFGAACASFVWFFTLGYGAKRLAPVFENPKSWKILDIFIGLVMVVIAIGLIQAALNL